MEYALLGALLLGILLFTIGWLVVIVQGFQRHPLVGLFTLIPGLNLITIPALWHRISGWFITGMIGLIITAGAWFAGADTYLFNQFHSLGLSPPQQALAAPSTPRQPASAPTEASTTVTKPLALPADNTNQQSVPVQPEGTANTAAVTPPQPAAETPPALPPTHDLPNKPLYRIVFKTLPVGNLPEQIGEYVRIIQTNGQQIEGKLLEASNKEIILDSSQHDAQGKLLTQTIKLNELQKAFLMVNEKGED